MSFSTLPLLSSNPPLKFGQISLERFYDEAGTQHNYLEINLSNNQYDYYFTHQLNSVQYRPIPALVTLTERYQPQDLTRPTIFSSFKRDLMTIVNQTKQDFPQMLDEFSQDELASVTALLTRPDSYIRKSKQEDYFLSVPHSNTALQGLEGKPTQALPPYLTWPPGDSLTTMGIQRPTAPKSNQPSVDTVSKPTPLPTEESNTEVPNKTSLPEGSVPPNTPSNNPQQENNTSINQHKFKSYLS